MRIRLFVYTCIRVNVFMCVYVCIRVYTCVYVCIRVYTFVYLNTCICVYVYVYMCISVCVYMYICIRAGAYLGFSRSVADIQPLFLLSPYINPSRKRSLAGTGKWVRAYTYAYKLLEYMYTH